MDSYQQWSELKTFLECDFRCAVAKCNRVKERKRLETSSRVRAKPSKKSAMLVAAAFVFLSALSFHFGAVDVVAVRFDCLCV